MPSYYANKNDQSNGDHEVHTGSCAFLPDSQNRIYLGEHPSCRPAVQAAKTHFTQVNGCYYCCRECHTQ